MGFFLKIKAIALDIDGTITDERGIINLNALKTIRMLESKNIRVVLTTGNAFPVVMGLRKYLGCSGVVIGENGGIVGEYNNFVILGDPKIGLRARKLILEKLNQIFVESWQNPYRHIDFAFKLKINIPREKGLRILRDALKNIPNVRAMDSGVAYHVGDSRIDKGRGLEIAAEMMDLSLDEFMAIGDSDTDIALFRKAGLSIAVNNASENLKKIASIVTSKPYWMGFVEAIQYLR